MPILTDGDYGCQESEEGSVDISALEKEVNLYEEELKREKTYASHQLATEALSSVAQSPSAFRTPSMRTSPKHSPRGITPRSPTRSPTSYAEMVD